MQTVPKMSGPTTRLNVQCLKYTSIHGPRNLFLGFDKDGTVYPVVFAVVNATPHFFDPHQRAYCDYIETIPLCQGQGYAKELWAFVAANFSMGLSGEAATWNGGRFLKSVGAISKEVDISRFEGKSCPCCGRSDEKTTTDSGTKSETVEFCDDTSGRCKDAIVDQCS